MSYNTRSTYILRTLFFFALLPCVFTWFHAGGEALKIRGFMRYLTDPLGLAALIGYILLITEVWRPKHKFSIGFLCLVVILAFHVYSFFTWYFIFLSNTISWNFSIESAKPGFYLSLAANLLYLIFYVIIFKTKK